MNFKPTKWKVIVSIILAIILTFGIPALFHLWCNLKGGICLQMVNRCDYYSAYHCCSKCVSLAGMILEIFLSFIIPLIIVYVIWSLIEKKK